MRANLTVHKSGRIEVALIAENSTDKRQLTRLKQCHPADFDHMIRGTNHVTLVGESRRQARLNEAIALSQTVEEVE